MPSCIDSISVAMSLQAPKWSGFWTWRQFSISVLMYSSVLNAWQNDAKTFMTIHVDVTSSYIASVLLQPGDYLGTSR